MKRFLRSCLWLVLLTPVSVSFALKTSPFISLSKDEILLGDRVQLQIKVKQPEKGSVNIFLIYNKELDLPLEILNSVVDSIYTGENQLDSLLFTFNISAYQDGNYYILPSIHSLGGAKDTAFITYLDTIFLSAKSLVIDTTIGIRDISPIKKETIHFSEFKIYLLILLLVLAFLLGLYYLYRLYIGKPLFFRPPTPLPPHEKALLELNALKGQELWQKGRTKEYYSQLIDILRFYALGRFGIIALEMTSDELLRSLSTFAEIPSSMLSNIETTLHTSDLVKFAKSNPLPHENQRCFDHVLAFIQNTIPIEMPNDSEPLSK